MIVGRDSLLSRGLRLALCSMIAFASVRALADDRPVNYLPPSGSVSEPSEPVLTHDRAQTSGLGVGVGLGSDNVGAGGHLIYYAQLPNPRLRVAFHVGAGMFPYSNDTRDWGVRGGSFLAYGMRHRMVLGVTGGTMDWTEFGLHFQHLRSEQLFGVGITGGYEYMGENGFYLRANVGPALAFSRKTPFVDRETHLVWRGTLLSLGYKIW